MQTARRLLLLLVKQGFAKKKGYAHATPVTRVIDGGEPMEFKALFRSWKDKNQTVGLGKTNTRGNIGEHRLIVEGLMWHYAYLN